MKVLIIGATGNLGLRLSPALLTHGHTVSAFVRSARKLESLLPASIYSQITVIEGNATDSAAIKSAILTSNSDAVINCAGVAALPPWGSSDLPAIFRAVLTGVLDASSERGKPLRVWFLAGLGVLHYPGSESMLSNYIPIYLEHRANLRLLRALPAEALDWSVLCPSTMTPEFAEVSVPTKSPSGKLVASAGSPPLWKGSWIEYVPWLGRAVMCGMNAPRYDTTLEQCADFIAGDLGSGEGRWRGTTVGIIDASK
jgi:putative NADH-flavin reductase